MREKTRGGRKRIFVILPAGSVALHDGHDGIVPWNKGTIDIAIRFVNHLDQLIHTFFVLNVEGGEGDKRKVINERTEGPIQPSKLPTEGIRVETV